METNDFLMAGVALSVIVILATGFGGGLNLFSTLPFSGGFTTLQLQLVTFLQGNDPILSGKVWALTAVPLGMSQWVEGSTTGDTFTSSEINDGDNKATKNLKIDITNHKQRCVYSIETDVGATPIYAVAGQLYQRDFFGLGGCPSNLYSECSKLGVPLASGGISNSNNCGCIYGIKSSAQIATLPTEADRLYETEVTINNGQETLTATVSNWNTNIAKIGSVAYVKGLDLASGLSCPSTSQYLVLGSGTRWKLISNSAYQTWKNLYDKYFITGQFTISGDQAFWHLVGDLDSASRSVFSEQQWCKDGYGCAYLDSGTFQFTPQKTVVNPIIQMYVKADWLGIAQPVAKPQLSVLDVPQEIGGVGGYVRFGVKNVGDGRGTAVISLSCDYLAKQQGGNVELFLEPGQYKESSIGITTDKVASRTKISCTVNAQMLSSADTKIFTTYVNPDVLCTPGKKACSAGGVIQCSASGTEWLTVDQCEGTETCQYKDGDFKCVADFIPAEPGINPVLIIAILAVAVVGFMVVTTK